MLARVGELTMGVRASPTSFTPKGKAPLRACPPDFDVIFVEQGRLACEAWYRARRDTVNRWLEERGKKRLVDLRAAFVSSQRKAGRWITRQTCMVEVRKIQPQPLRHGPIRDRRKVSYTLVRHAAQFLRIARNGGWVVSQASNGDWWVGSKRLSAAQLVDLAANKGFDSSAAMTDEHEVRMKVGGRHGSSDEREAFAQNQRERYRRESGNADRGLGADWRNED